MRLRGRLASSAASRDSEGFNERVTWAAEIVPREYRRHRVAELLLEAPGGRPHLWRHDGLACGWKTSRDAHGRMCGCSTASKQEHLMHEPGHRGARAPDRCRCSCSFVGLLGPDNGDGETDARSAGGSSVGALYRSRLAWRQCAAWRSSPASCQQQVCRRSSVLGAVCTATAPLARDLGGPLRSLRDTERLDIGAKRGEGALAGWLERDEVGVSAICVSLTAVFDNGYVQ
ncbi:hypothetical protein BC628DRAFT_393419 [Trametes gibbosa]|nr:hypothetical protein BC628DRAFT_393419 [Trametes gibbosa]